MLLKLDSDNYLILDIEKGGRILELKLIGKIIIKANSTDLGSGNYLMYPWVNRVEQVPLKDVKNPYNDGHIPLHGLYVDQPRNAVISTPSQNCLQIQLTPKKIIDNVPAFTETYTLKKGKLSLKFKVNNSQTTLPVCFGYHPYLQIDNEPLQNLYISTNIKTNLKLDSLLLPVFPYERQQLQIRNNEKYDHLFEGGSYFKLTNKNNFIVTIKSNLSHWQIYTPPDGIRIAVEPMSFTGNMYKISEKGFTPSLNQGYFQIQASD